MDRKRRIALAISLAVLVSSLSACHRIFQPSCVDIARANFSFLEDPIQVKTELDIVSRDVVAYYGTTVDCFMDNAYWSGDATVFYNNTYFTQECISQKDATQSAKMWRGQWAEADTGNPLDILKEWMVKVENGICIYEKRPVTELICDEEVQVYQLTLNDTSVDWNSLCDVDFDSLFGGAGLLGNVENVEVVLQIDAKSLRVRRVLLSATGKTWCNVTVDVQSTETPPHVEWDSDWTENAYLREEWDILGSVQNKKNTQPD